jgi:hypothetical protein
MKHENVKTAARQLLIPLIQDFHRYNRADPWKNFFDAIF